MNKRLAMGAVALTGLAGLAGMAHAQAAAADQVWDVRFVVSGAGATNANAVTITMQARVAIKPTASNTNNFGVSRVGGNNGTFFISATDPANSAGAFSTFEQGATGQGNDVNSNPLAGTFLQFRQGYSPSGTGGSNTDVQNGIYTASAANAQITNLIHGRTTGYDGTPLGVASGTTVATLTGAYADIYRFVYIPRPGTNNRTITVNVTGISARYLFQNNGGGNMSNSSALNLPNQQFSFVVPTPGAAALVGLAGLAGLRRRRA